VPKLKQELERQMRAYPVWPMRDQSPAAWHPSQGGEASLFQDAISEFDVTGSGIMKDAATRQMADNFAGILARRGQLKRLAKPAVKGVNMSGVSAQTSPTTLRKNFAEALRGVRRTPQEALDPVQRIDVIDQPYAAARGVYFQKAHPDSRVRTNIAYNLAALTKNTVPHEISHAWQDKLGEMRNVFIEGPLGTITVPGELAKIEAHADEFAKAWQSSFEGTRGQASMKDFKAIYKATKLVTKHRVKVFESQAENLKLLGPKAKLHNRKKLYPARLALREASVELDKLTTRLRGRQSLEGALIRAHEQYDPYAKFKEVVKR